MKRASAFMEYAIVLGVVAAAFFTMNIYIKRGLQARVKDMADYFINEGQEVQVVQIDPNVTTTSDSNVISNSTFTNEMFLEGERKLALLDNTTVTASSTIKDLGRPSYQPDTVEVIPAEAGQVVVPGRPKEDENYDIEKAKTENEIAVLEKNKESLLMKAEITEETAQKIKAEGEKLIKKAKSMGCPKKHGGACRAARKKMLAAGQKMVKDANQQLQEAADLRKEADDVQAEIDELEGADSDE